MSENPYKSPRLSAKTGQPSAIDRITEEGPRWKPYRMQVVVLLALAFGPLLIGVALAIILPFIQSLRS